DRLRLPPGRSRGRRHRRAGRDLRDLGAGGGGARAAVRPDGRTDPGMRDSGVRVAPLRVEDLPAALPLFAGYQSFYEAQPDDGANLRFFRRFVDPSEDGLLLGAWVGDDLVG